jgi:hypothetical protein
MGSLALAMAIVLTVVVPKVDSNDNDEPSLKTSSELTFTALFWVRKITGNK